MAARRIGAILVILTVLLAVSVRAVAAAAIDDEVRRIGKELQCPVCQGASVADSPSELAEQMRGVIRRKLEQGESEEQIVQYFVERYGEAVLVEPPRHGLGLAVWLGPLVVLAVGGGVLCLLVQAWLRQRAVAPSPVLTPLVAHRNGTVGGAAPEPPEPPEPYNARVRAELDRYRQES